MASRGTAALTVSFPELWLLRSSTGGEGGESEGRRQEAYYFKTATTNGIYTIAVAKGIKALELDRRRKSVKL